VGLTVAGGSHPQRLAVGQIGDSRAAVWHGKDGRKVAGGRDGAGLAAGVDDDVGAGDERGLGQRDGGAVQLMQDLGRRQTQVYQRVSDRAEPAHDGRGLGTMTHHVADDQPAPFPGQRDDVIPVAADVIACRRQTSSGDLKPAGRHPADRRIGLLQRLRDRSAPHQRQGAGDGGPGANGQVRGGPQVGVAEHRGTGGTGKDKEADRRAPGDHRRGQERRVAAESRPGP